MLIIATIIIIVATKKARMIFFAARDLNLQDRGEVNSFLSEGESFTYICSLCGRNIRIGFLKKEHAAVRWCYICKRIFGTQRNDDDDDDDNNKDVSPIDPPPDDGEPIPEGVKNLTDQLMQRVQTNQIKW